MLKRMMNYELDAPVAKLHQLCFLKAGENHSTLGAGNVFSGDWNVAPLWFWKTLKIIDRLSQEKVM